MDRGLVMGPDLRPGLRAGSNLPSSVPQLGLYFSRILFLMDTKLFGIVFFHHQKMVSEGFQIQDYLE